MTSPDWGLEVSNVVDGWLLDRHEDLPSTLLIPLENPHLHDDRPWVDVFGPAQGRNGVFAMHDVDGAKVAIARPVLGTAAVAMVADAASRRGVRTVIGVGFCGGTQPDLSTGDVVAAEVAVLDDGVSQRYLPGAARVSASPALLGGLNGDVRRGAVQSVAAVHLETQVYVDGCRSAGIEAIDLETVTLHAVAASRRIDAVSLLTVSDVPARGEHADAALLQPGHRVSLEAARRVVAAAT